MTSLVDKVKQRLSSKKESTSDRGSISRTSSLRSTLSRSLSRKDKKNKGNPSGDEDKGKSRDKKGSKERFSFESTSPDSYKLAPKLTERSSSHNSSAASSQPATQPSDAIVGTSANPAKDDTATDIGELGFVETPQVSDARTDNAALVSEVLPEVRGPLKLDGDIPQQAEDPPEQAEDAPQQAEDAISQTNGPTLTQSLAGSSPKPKSAPTEGTGEISQAAVEILPDLIQASSTPIQDSHPGYGNDQTSTKSVEIENGDDHDPTESAPLLSLYDPVRYTDLEGWGGVDDGEPYHDRSGLGYRVYDYLFRENAWSTFIFSFLIVLIVVITYSTLSNIESLINEAVLPDIQSVSLLDITETGVTVHVIGSIYVEYERIPNYFYRNVLKVAGVLIGGVTVVPRDGCKVYLSGENIPLTHVVDLFPPGQSVDLINRRITEIDFISEAQLIQENVVDLAQSLMTVNRLLPLPLDLEVETSPQVKSKWFHYSADTISIDHHVVLEPSQMSIPLQIDDLQVSMGNSSVALKVEASTLTELPMEFELSAIEWDVALPDCQNEPTLLGEWVSDAFRVQPKMRASVSVHGKVKEVPSALLEECSDGLSPFNRFTNDLLGENELKVFTRAKNCKENEQSLPPWLYKVLSSNFFAISAPVPSSQLDFVDLVSNYTLENVSLAVPSRSSGLFAQVNGELSLDVHLPFQALNVQASVSEIMATFAVLDLSKEIIEVELHGENSLNFQSAADSRSGIVTASANNVNVEVLSPRRIGKLINRFLNNLVVDLPMWDFDLELAFFQLPVITTTLRHLRVQHGLPHTVVSEGEDESFFDRLLRLMDVNIENIFYVQSNKTSVDFVIDLKLTNPLNLLLDVPNDTLTFEYLYNKTAIGTVSIENIEIPANVTDLDMSVSMSLSCLTNEQRLFAEEFVSKVISAAEGTAVGVKGLSSKKNQDLGALLTEIELDDIKFPMIRFEDDDGEETNSVATQEDETPPTRKSPFLIDATIHVLTSEIELTIYNPVSNAELMAEIIKCQASYKGETLANIDKSELMLIPPGIYKSPRIPIKVAQGIGSDILRKAMNGNLYVEVTASIGVRIDKFSMQLLYHGEGLTATVKL